MYPLTLVELKDVFQRHYSGKERLEIIALDYGLTDAQYSEAIVAANYIWGERPKLYPRKRESEKREGEIERETIKWRNFHPAKDKRKEWAKAFHKSADHTNRRYLEEYQ